MVLACHSCKSSQNLFFSKPYGIDQLRNAICGALRDLVAFVQFKIREKHLWRSVNLINTPPWVFFTFLKLYKCYQIAQRITFMLNTIHPEAMVKL